MSQQHINYSLPNDGLGDTLRVSQIKAENNFNELYGGKVDKIVGKGLSDTNFTQLEKDKLASLDPDMAVQSDFAVTDPDDPAFILNKPTNTSDFTNDGNGTEPYITDVPTSGNFVRASGTWVSVGASLKPITLGAGLVLTAPSNSFELPPGAVCHNVFANESLVTETTNAAFVARWQQTGVNVITSKTYPANTRMVIQYLL